MQPPAEEGSSGVTGKGAGDATMPPCHIQSKEGKSQVSPSGASTDRALHLGAIIASSYLKMQFHRLCLSSFCFELGRLLPFHTGRHQDQHGCSLIIIITAFSQHLNSFTDSENNKLAPHRNQDHC